jgi:orotidine-5'-phosphate decarboxylase
MKELAKERLIVALDVETAHQALEFVRRLRDMVGMFKVGSQLFTAAGPEIVRQIVRSGSRIFLDLKFHDIPNTVAAAGVEAARLGVSLFNVHASGGGEMMRRTADAVTEAADREGFPRPAVLAVTVLTSSDASTLLQVGITSVPEQQVRSLALLAAESVMDGVIVSPREIAAVRSVVQKDDFLVISPGVRPFGVPLGDQKRVMTPAQAIKQGADYLVVGRPITGAKDPIEAARLVVKEMENALS